MLISLHSPYPPPAILASLGVTSVNSPVCTSHIFHVHTVIIPYYEHYSTTCFLKTKQTKKTRRKTSSGLLTCIPPVYMSDTQEN